MRRFRRHGARLRALTVATMTGIAAVLVLPTGPAAATPSCRGATCTGYLAADKGCVTGAFAIAGFQITDPTIADQPRGDLYYSPACQAAWGEYHTDPDLDGRMLTLYLQPMIGGVESAAYRINDIEDEKTITTMISWMDHSVKFCAFANYDPDLRSNNGSLDLSNVCSRWR